MTLAHLVIERGNYRASALWRVLPDSQLNLRPNGRPLAISGPIEWLVEKCVEAGIFNKHFKRKVQTKVPLNIRTKKQMSTEAIMQQVGLN